MTYLLNIIIYVIARLLQLSFRISYEGIGHLSQQKNHILAVWHQNLLPGILAQVERPYVVIVSRSKDAEPVAYTCQRLGHRVTRGSSRKNGVDKGGTTARDEMITWLKSGLPGAVTVDGPKGPAFRAKIGIIHMAREAQCAIVPYTVKATHYYQFNSWDRFQLPLPFSKIIVSYGPPISADELRELSDEQALKMLDERLSLESSELEGRLKKAPKPSYSQPRSRRNKYSS
jgi:lysophospholipid acyltransferase (LPLAT)-like uncharacterized protein